MAGLAATGVSGGGALAILGGLLVIWLILLLVVPVVTLIAGWKVVSKTGYPGAWVLITLVPILGSVMLLVFAFSDWPIEKRLRWLSAQAQSAGSVPAGQGAAGQGAAGQGAAWQGAAWQGAAGQADSTMGRPAADAAPPGSQGSGPVPAGSLPAPGSWAAAPRTPVKPPDGVSIALLVCGGLYFVLQFFTWNQVCIDGGCYAASSGWSGIGILSGLLIISLLTWEGLAIRGVLRSVEPGVRALLPPGLGAGVALITLLRVLASLGGATLMAWLGLLLSLGIGGLAVARWRGFTWPPGLASPALAGSGGGLPAPGMPGAWGAPEVPSPPGMPEPPSAPSALGDQPALSAASNPGWGASTRPGAVSPAPPPGTPLSGRAGPGPAYPVPSPTPTSPGAGWGETGPVSAAIREHSLPVAIREPSLPPAIPGSSLPPAAQGGDWGDPYRTSALPSTSPVGQPPASSYCRRCGAENPPRHRFCEACGTELGSGRLSGEDGWKRCGCR